MSARGRGLDRTALLVIGLTVALAGAYWAAVELSQEYYFVQSPPGSTFDAGPSGTQVLHNYLKELGVETRTLQRFDELPESGTIVVVAEEPFAKPPSNADVRAIRDWIEAGGRLVMVGPFASELPRGSLGGSTVRGREGSMLEPLLPSVYAQEVERVAVGEDRMLLEDPVWVAHLKDIDGQVLVSRTFGEGEVVWLAGTYPVSNEGIGEADNARLATLLTASREPVYFDEYHHGFVSGGGVWERLGGNGRAAAVLGVLALVVMLLAGGRRLAPAIEPPPVRRARGGAYIASLAELYRKAGARPEALATLAEGLRIALRRRYGSVEAARARDSSAYEVWDRAREIAGRGRLSEDEFTEMAREIARARREVDGRDG